MKYVTQSSRVDMKLIFLLTLVSVIRCHGDRKEDMDTYLSRLIADLWIEGGDVVRILWRDCSKKLVDVKDVIDHKEYFPKFVRCMKRKTLRALDRSLSTDIVPLIDGINLVRFELVDRSGNIMPDNDTSIWTEKELEEGEWRTLALHRMAKVLRTHVVKFDLENLKEGEKGIVEYRGRRRHQMMTMMMFGVVSIGMVVIPMGFQFLAVLGGKALLLAKMALILASIQGLKKIASSPLSYGFYHSYPPYEHYEKRSNDWPPPAVMPATPPPTLSKQNPWSNVDGTIKIDRIHLGQPERQDKQIDIVTWKPELPKTVKRESEPRLYPVYTNSEGSVPSILTAIDAPTSLTDLTTKPGEVQADYTLDLPYNGFHFQSPATVVST